MKFVPSWLYDGALLQPFRQLVVYPAGNLFHSVVHPVAGVHYCACYPRSFLRHPASLHENFVENLWGNRTFLHSDSPLETIMVKIVMICHCKVGFKVWCTICTISEDVWSCFLTLATCFLLLLHILLLHKLFALGEVSQPFSFVFTAGIYMWFAVKSVYCRG